MLVPRSSRHRGVLSLKYPVNVYDFRNAPTDTLQDMVASSSEAQSKMKTKTILTHRMIKRNDGLGLADLVMKIHATKMYSEQDEKKHDKCSLSDSLTCIVSIPQTWSPNLYLGLLNTTINDYNVIAIDNTQQPTMNGLKESCNTLNTVHINFCVHNLEHLERNVIMEGRYRGVHGGALVN